MTYLSLSVRLSIYLSVNWAAVVVGPEGWVPAISSRRAVMYVLYIHPMAWKALSRSPVGDDSALKKA